MRGEIILWLALVFLAGTVVGRFAVPLFEPHVANRVDVGNNPNARTCTLAIVQETTVLGRRTSYLEEVHGMKCNEQRGFGDTLIQCRCAN
jgi:hypothetical protein